MLTVSVIIPTFNRCTPLKNAIESVLAQTFHNLEIIVINDGSTDQTSKYLSTLEESRFRYFEFETNRGGNYARNEGIKHANGAYIAFLDDDDYWEPTKLEEQIHLIQEHNVDLCYTGFNLYTHNKKFIKYAFHPPRYVNIYKSIMNDNFLGSTSSVLVKKKLVEEAGCFDHNLPALQDYDLFIRLIKHGCKIKGINKPLVKYYIVDVNRSISCSFKNYKAAANYLCNKYRDDQFSNLLKRRLKIIEIKRLFKSKPFLFDSVRFYSKQLFNLLFNKKSIN